MLSSENSQNIRPHLGKMAKGLTYTLLEKECHLIFKRQYVSTIINIVLTFCLCILQDLVANVCNFGTLARLLNFEIYNFLLLKVPKS